MKYFIYSLCFICLLLLASLFYTTHNYKQLEETYKQEKALFDARHGEIVNLQDEIGAYQDSCWMYRKELKKCLNTNGLN